MALAGATPGALAVLGWSRVPDGTPLARRSKQLYGVLGAFVTDVARRKAGLAEALRLTHRSEDKRLVKAQGPVWDQADRQHGHVPEKLRHLDTDARWSKRADQGWAMDATRSYHRFSQQADRPPSCAPARQPLSRCSTSSATYLAGLPNRRNCLSNASPKFARV